MVDNIINLVCFWFIYSFLGWICEVIYAKIRNLGYAVRNSTNGPINPGYGFAAIIMITLLKHYRSNPIIVFFLGGIIASILEFFTHWFFEKTTGVRLWDYSKRAFNLQGRICLGNSILFGLLCVFLITIIHPLIDQYIYYIPLPIKFIISSFLTIIYTIEVTAIYVSVYFLDKILDEMEKIWQVIKSIKPNSISSFRKFIEDIDKQNKTWTANHRIENSYGKINNISDKLNLSDNDYSDEQNILIVRLSQIIQDKFSEKSFYQKVLYRVFPDLKSINHDEIFEVIKDQDQKKRKSKLL